MHYVMQMKDTSESEPPQVAHTWEVCIRPGVRIVDAAAMPLLIHLAGPGLSPEMQKPSVQELSPMTSKEVRS